MSSLSSKSPKGTSFTHTALYQHLHDIGEDKIAYSLEKCGQNQRGIIMVNCNNCGYNRVTTLDYRCNFSICPNCYRKRKNRILRDYLPILNQYKICNSHNNVMGYGLRFLTISPKNYSCMEEGFEHIRKSFQKFIRRKYIQERIDGYIYCIEGKQKEGRTWNIHLHAIILSKFLDMIKRNNEKPRLIREAEESFSGDVHIDIKLCRNQEHALNYLLKYISKEENCFQTAEDYARYVVYTHNKNLIVKGKVFRGKVAKQPIKCRCGGYLTFSFEFEIDIRKEVSDKAQRDYRERVDFYYDPP
ncbi:protein rep [Candidatus Woesearchaeota archaeon]|nr:protein rep [Candidatus Woesearchaeota archaeon]